MSTTAARRAWQTLTTVRRVIAIEAMSAAHALRWRLEQEPDTRLGRGTRAAYDAVISVLSDEGTPSARIAAVEQAIADGRLVRAVREAGVTGDAL